MQDLCICREICAVRVGLSVRGIFFIRANCSINTKQHGVIHIVHIVRGPSRDELKMHRFSELK